MNGNIIGEEIQHALDAIDQGGLIPIKQRAVYNLISDYSDRANPRLIKMAVIASATVISPGPGAQNHTVAFVLDIEDISTRTGISIGSVIQILYDKFNVSWRDDLKPITVELDAAIFK